MNSRKPNRALTKGVNWESKVPGCGRVEADRDCARQRGDWCACEPAKLDSKCAGQPWPRAWKRKRVDEKSASECWDMGELWVRRVILLGEKRGGAAEAF